MTNFSFPYHHLSTLSWFNGFRKEKIQTILRNSTTIWCNSTKIQYFIPNGRLRLHKIYTTTSEAIFYSWMYYNRSHVSEYHWQFLGRRGSNSLPLLSWNESTQIHFLRALSIEHFFDFSIFAVLLWYRKQIKIIDILNISFFFRRLS